MNLTKWTQRIRRADELAAAHPFAGDVLRFYHRVATSQQRLYDYLREVPAASLDALMPQFTEFVSEFETAAPGPIAQAAKEWKTRDACALLESHWQSFSPDGSPEALIARLLLQPYAEHLAEQSNEIAANGATRFCPFCSRKPAVGVLRPQGDGAKRSLICSMCSTEWAFGRVLCPACGEDNVEKLAIYTAQQFAYVRVEACDSCGCYIKTIDLTKNGRAVPIVDELATIPLNLWAEEHHYAKLQPNLLGI